MKTVEAFRRTKGGKNKLMVFDVTTAVVTWMRTGFHMSPLCLSHNVVFTTRHIPYPSGNHKADLYDSMAKQQIGRCRLRPRGGIFSPIIFYTLNKTF